MYASIITTKLKSEKIDQAVETLREILTNASPEGWQHTHLVIDRQTGQLTSFGVWDSEKDAIAYETSGRFQQDAQKMQAFMQSVPERATGEIVLTIQR